MMTAIEQPAQPSDGLGEPANALEAAEYRAALEERELTRALATLTRQRTELSQQLEALRVDAANARRGGARYAEVQTVQRRIAATLLPELDLSSAWRAAVEARRAAVAARLESNRAAREALRQWTEAFDVLATSLRADQAVVARAELEATEAARTPATPHHVEPLAVSAQPGPEVAVEGRRATARAPLRTAVDFTTESNFFTGFTGDISLGGIFVATHAQVAVGKGVTLELTLPTGRHLQLEGVVRWTREFNDLYPDTTPGAGVEFRDLAPDALAAIREFISQREPLFFPD